ncbi:hypothetical protein SD71_05475 [Cohnella kolymensis]|uniref:Uncharacterized protein n=1 Tax=Cohnella kolymensis TaxID=1590652 RepID=A0ABR5A723_9BACL|nr:hypothetical protein [Cohnella kolymensis]KIL36851.1 hypothetical protein SD71_05475 [Cohnella kolymensis]
MWLTVMIVLAAIFNVATPAKAAEPPAAVQQWKLDGIQLGDKASRVKGAWGNPFKVAEDNLTGCKVWKYREGKSVGMCDGVVSFVQVTAEAGSAVINRKSVPMVQSKLKQALGKPAFVADDGWGVLKGEEALKVFVDNRGKLLSIELFADPCGV